MGGVAVAGFVFSKMMVVAGLEIIASELGWLRRRVWFGFGLMFDTLGMM